MWDTETERQTDRQTEREREREGRKREKERARERDNFWQRASRHSGGVPSKKAEDISTDSGSLEEGEATRLAICQCALSAGGHTSSPPQGRDAHHIYYYYVPYKNITRLFVCIILRHKMLIRGMVLTIYVPY